MKAAGDTQTFLWLLFYQGLLRSLVYLVSFLPFALVLTLPLNSTTPQVAAILASLAAVPVLILLQTALLLRLMPTAPTGRHPFRGKAYFAWLRTNIVSEYVGGLASLNDIVQRMAPLKVLYYGMLGYRSPWRIIMAPGVRLLDPTLCRFEPNVFLGVSTVVASHTVKSLKLLVAENRFGRNVMVGSFCRFAVGVTVDEDSWIDYGVEVGMLTRIGKNVRIFASVKVDDEVTIGDNVVIGKGAQIGRKSTIGDGCVIGGYSRLGSRVHLEPGTKLPEMTDLKN